MIISHRFATLVLAVILPLAGFGARAASLEDVLAPLSGDSAGGAQIREAIDTSPTLKKRMQALAEAGQLTAMRIVPDTQAPVVRDHAFAAATDGTTLVLTEGLLVALRQNRRYDVVREDDVLPDNTVFVLSHLTHHLESSKALAQLDADIRDKVSAAKEQANRDGTPFDPKAIIEYATQGNLRIEGAGLIQGWNAVVDAAVHTKGKGQPLDEVTRAQMFGPLLINLRYREIFSKAMELPEGQRIQLLIDGIPLDQRNIDAMAAALRTSDVHDVE